MPVTDANEKKKMTATPTRHTVTLKGGAGFANAVRMSLLSDVTNVAPKSVTFEANTTCFNSEMLAHRIGLIPFRAAGEGDTLTLDITGPKVVYARDLVGTAYVPVHDFIDIAHLGTAEQTLKLTVHFDRQRAGKHARYSPCCAVGMRRLDGDGRYEIGFELLDPERSASDVLREALDALDARLDGALRQLSHQPAHPPQSCCR